MVQQRFNVKKNFKERVLIHVMELEIWLPILGTVSHP